MSSVEMTRGHGVGTTWLAGARHLAVGSALALLPVTSILVLGWLMRDMRRETLRLWGTASEAVPGWIMGSRGDPFVPRVLGGLAQNIKTGMATLMAFALGTLPFAGFWIVSWWAGWDNSFNKGYEQAFIGPLTGLSGVAIFMIMMVYIPLAQAHMAAEGRFGAFFEFARIRSAFRHTGWRYVFWTAGLLLFSLPVFAARGLPTFAEGIIPDFAEFTTQQLTDLAMGISVIMAVYIFASLVVFRRWQARLYAHAALRASQGKDAALWDGTMAAGARQDIRTSGGLTVLRPLRFCILATLWFGLAALIYIGQFLNHSWHVWLTHPLIFLPWMP